MHIQQGFPVITHAKVFEGIIRRDFLKIQDFDTPVEEVVTLLQRHIDCTMNPSTVQKLTEMIYRHPEIAHDVYAISKKAERYASLEDISKAIDLGFTFRDKYSLRWALIYAVISLDKHGKMIAEFGITERPLVQLQSQLQNQSSPTTTQSKMSEFFAETEKRNAPCYLWTLECATGELDELSLIRDNWKKHAVNSGTRVPSGHSLRRSIKRFSKYYTDRGHAHYMWPSWNDVLEQGICVRTGDFAVRNFQYAV